MILIDQRRSIKIMKISVLSSPGIRRESAGNPGAVCVGLRPVIDYNCSEIHLPYPPAAAKTHAPHLPRL